jgi:predicted transcriptional regulator
VALLSDKDGVGQQTVDTLVARLTKELVPGSSRSEKCYGMVIIITVFLHAHSFSQKHKNRLSVYYPASCNW